MHAQWKHAAAVLLRAGPDRHLFFIPKTHTFNLLQGPLMGFFFAHVFDFRKPDADISQHIQMCKQVEILKDHADLGSDAVNIDLGRMCHAFVQDRHTIQDNLALVGL